MVQAPATTAGMPCGSQTRIAAQVVAAEPYERAELFALIASGRHKAGRVD